MTEDASRAAPGWHGKLPTLGDFASRGLAPAFLEAWDAWLAQGLAHLQQQQGGAWLQAYLDSPSWRFVLAPGVLGDQAWAGVLMPSVDRVGRYFPFTIAQALPSLPTCSADGQALSAWLDRLDDLAVSALYDDWRIEQLEQALQSTLLPVPATHRADDAGMGGLLCNHALTLLAQQARDTAWWLGSRRDGPPRVLITRGLPRAHGFSALLGGGHAGVDTAPVPPAALPP